MEEQRKRFPCWILIILFFLLGLIIGALSLYFLEYTHVTNVTKCSKEDAPAKSSDNKKEDNSQNGSNSNAPSTTAPYTGTYVSGQLPTDWKIVEYTTNAGSDMIMSGITYSRLVGLKVFNQNNVEMFYLKAVDGIGGVEGCNTVYKFADSSAAYLAHGNDWNNEVGTVPSTVVDLTNSTYVEYNMLGWKVRRIGKTLYRNMDPNHAGFNPACGIDTVFSISKLYFNRTDSGNTTKGYAYSMTIPNTAVQSQLEELDDVLKSLSVN